MTKTRKPKRNVFKEPNRYGHYAGPRGDEAHWRAAFGEAWDQAFCKTLIGDQSPWEVLGIAVGASWDEIKKAYRGLIRKWHPDINKDPNAVEQCKKIIAAYTLLEETQN